MGIGIVVRGGDGNHGDLYRRSARAYKYLVNGKLDGCEDLQAVYLVYCLKLLGLSFATLSLS